MSSDIGGFYPELEEFLSVPGRTLLIKGSPGVGKTTLALSLLQYLCANSNTNREQSSYPTGVYFSTRVPGESLEAQFPWVSFSELNIEDLRLTSIEGFLNELLKKIRVRSPVVVLDSWDAYAKEMDEKERLKTEKTIVSIFMTSKSRVIFVSEETKQTTLDYLVDGVVELTTETVDSRLFRASYLRKLRGLSIVHHVRPYTLLGARIRGFNVYEDPDYTFVHRVEVSPDFDGKYSYGTHNFDEKLGGLPYGSTLTVEYTPDVPLTAVSCLAQTMIVNFALMGRSVIIVPPPGVSPQILAKWLVNVVGEEIFYQHIAIFHEGENTTSNFKNTFFSLDDDIDRSAEEFEALAERFRRTSVDGRLLFVRSLSVLEDKHYNNLNRLAALVARRISEAQNMLDAQIYFVENTSTIKPKVVSMSNRHVKLAVKNGVVLVYGEKPYTPLYVLEYENRDPLSPKITEVI
ncbi:MAG: gas vesicle protein GvpD P-loop domain-containing protein [Thermoprotei archaeon]